jgi:hypothetical protein
MLNIIVSSAAWTCAVFKQVRTYDSKRCDPKADSQFLAIERVLMEPLWIFRSPMQINLFVHSLWQVELWFVIRIVLITSSSFIGAKIYSIFKTLCLTSAIFSTKYHYFIIFSFLILNDTVFIWMLDHSNITPPNKTRLPRENIFFQIWEDPPINKMSAQKNVLLITAHT